MPCQRICYGAFLFIYIITGIGLAGGAVVLNHAAKNSEDYASQLSRAGRWYVGIISLYIMFSCIIHVLGICCKRLLMISRLAVVLLIFGILIELIGLALSVFLSNGSENRKSNLIVFGSVTGYLILLQIYGVIASLSYIAEVRHNYEELPSKK
jgi:hypothetical protein